MVYPGLGYATRARLIDLSPIRVVMHAERTIARNSEAEVMLELIPRPRISLPGRVAWSTRDAVCVAFGSLSAFETYWLNKAVAAYDSWFPLPVAPRVQEFAVDSLPPPAPVPRLSVPPPPPLPRLEEIPREPRYESGFFRRPEPRRSPAPAFVSARPTADECRRREPFKIAKD